MIRKRVRFRDVTFSFHIFEECEDEAFTFIEALRFSRKLISSKLPLFNLPRTVKILVMDKTVVDQEKDALGVFEHPYWKDRYQIVLYGENLREGQCLKPVAEYCGEALFIFFHELAHSITKDEDEANRIVRKIVTQ